MSEERARPPLLYLVGLGPGPVDLLTLGTWELVGSGNPLKVRDPEHEAAQTIWARGFHFETTSGDDPAALAGEVLDWALRAPRSVYAVPGHPLEAPETAALLRLAKQRGVEVVVVPAISDADRLPASDTLTRTHVSAEAMRAGLAFVRLVQVMARLRGPLGCPWDREQTHSSLAVHLLEETYEALDAIDREDADHLEEELGDLLLQIVFHSELAREEGRFEIADVVEELLAKLFYRHPHVFGDVVVTSAGEVVTRWEALKGEEKERSTVTDDLPRSLPALLYSYKLQRRLAGAGAADEANVAERIAKGAEVAQSEPSDEAIGELLYQVVALARQAAIDPEGALRRAAVRAAERKAL